MKLCITSYGPTLDSRLQNVFARCAFFILVDPLSMSFESVLNPNASAESDAGELSARLLVEHGATAVITAQVGPRAQTALDAAGVKVLTRQGGTVREAVEAFKEGSLVAEPSVP